MSGALVIVRNIEPEGGNQIVIKTRYLDGMPTMMGDRILQPGEKARFVIGLDEKLHVLNIKALPPVSERRAQRADRRRDHKERARIAKAAKADS